MFPSDAPPPSTVPDEPPEPPELENYPQHPFSSLPPSDYTTPDPPHTEPHPEPTVSFPPFFRKPPQHVPAPPPPPHPPRSSVSPPPPPPPPPPVQPKPPDGALMMKLGTLVVIGAIAANVFGFRYSRWAVGKDIHRAWERHQRQTASNRSYAQSRAEDEMRRMRDAFARAEKQATQQARAREENARSRAHQQRANRDQRQRENVRAKYTQWEKRFDQRNGTFHREQFRMDFDPKIMEDIMKQFGQASRMGFRVHQSSFSFDDRVIEELLKAARQQEQQRGQTRFEQDFDAFRFWEAMNGAQWRDYARSGANTGGVHQRFGMARHYQALGLQEGASEHEVKKAYRREVMKWHPDRYRGDDKHKAARRFREVTDAYSALTKK